MPLINYQRLTISSFLRLTVTGVAGAVVLFTLRR